MSDISPLKVGDWVIYRRPAALFGPKERLAKIVYVTTYRVSLECIDDTEHFQVHKRWCERITEEEAMLWKLQNS